MEKYYPLRLDVMKSFTNISAEFTQNDTETCGFNIELTSYGEPIDITGSVVVIGLMRPSGKVTIDFVTVTDPENGKAVYKFDKSVLSEAGKVQGIVQIYGDENKRLSTAKFQFIVTNDIVTRETIEEDDKYPILTKLINDFQSAISNIPNVAEIADEYNMYINTIKPEMLQVTEDAREAAQLAEQYISRQVIGSWSLTVFVENVSAEFKVRMKTPSLYWNKWAVFADETNLSGILPLDEGFVSTPLAFESDRLTVRFFDERTEQLTLICKFEKSIDLRGIKAGDLILVEEVNRG